jgi:hypothetical protein
MGSVRLVSCGSLIRLFLLLPLVTMAFEPASGEFQPAAVGNRTTFPPLLKRTLALDSPDLRPIPNSAPHDWLASHHEPGQTFDDLVERYGQTDRHQSGALSIFNRWANFSPEVSPSIVFPTPGTGTKAQKCIA